MTPKENLQEAFEATVTPRMEERGFHYVRSRFTYKRKSGDFIQQISIELSKYNTRTSIRFWSFFEVTSPKYNRWLKQQRRDSFNGALAGQTDWYVPGFHEPGDDVTSFVLSPPESPRAVLADWLGRCFSAGIPYLDRLSTWLGAADDVVRGGQWRRAADYCLIAGRSDRAIAVLRQGIGVLVAREYSYSQKTHPIMIAKKKRLAAERDAEVAAYRLRIEEIENSEPLHPADTERPRG